MSLGLIADIGATNARFALTDRKGFYHEQTLSCTDYPDIQEAVRAYLVQAAPSQNPDKASFAIAGPVHGDTFAMTNHGWAFSVEQVRKELGLESLHLMNDFKAVALAVPYIEADYLQKIGGGEPITGSPKAIIGPGTGLGVAGIVPDAWGRYVAIPGEGGHVTMPARTQRQFDIFCALRQKYRHVSAERVCSGKGLVNLYNAIKALDAHDKLPERTPEEISEAALSKTCTVCQEALDLMMINLGTTAGNLALTYGALGGVYIAGGIPAKLGGYFQQSQFYKEFISKGRFEDYLKPIPVYLIFHPHIAFVGLQADLFPP